MNNGRFRFETLSIKINITVKMLNLYYLLSLIEGSTVSWFIFLDRFLTPYYEDFYRPCEFSCFKELFFSIMFPFFTAKPFFEKKELTVCEKTPTTQLFIASLDFHRTNISYTHVIFCFRLKIFKIWHSSVD